MADQSIKLNIGGRVYPMVANSPEMESVLRMAAESINKKLAMYSAKYPTVDLADKLVFVAMNEAVSALKSKKEFSLADQETKEIEKLLENYLAKEKTSR